MASTTPAGAGGPNAGKAIDDSVRHLHLIDAMRTNDLAIITQAIRQLPVPTTSQAPTYGSPLHLAITLSSTPTIEHILQEFTEWTERYWVNAQNGDGETPLHAAARLGRGDVVEMLFRIVGVNDTLRDKAGRTAEEVAKSDRVGSLIIAHRTQYAETVLSQIRKDLQSQSPRAVIDRFESDPRTKAYLAMGWIDINAPVDTDSEHALLHFAARADDLELVNWALERGADPGVKDRKGKKPVDLTSRNFRRHLIPKQLAPKKDSKTKDRLKTAIAQAPIMSGSLPQATSATPGAAHNPQAAPSLRGTLFKWTNYAVGYKNRYFVLEHGNLSYYKSSTDYPLACRGSISTMIASVVLPDSDDKSRFDVIGKGSVRYSLQARSPADAKKWVWALMESKKYMIDRARDSSAGGQSITSSISENLQDGGGSAEWEGDDDSEGEAGQILASADGNEREQTRPVEDGASAVSSSDERDRRISATPTATGHSAGHASGDVLPVTTTHDVGTLMYLLNVQLDVQQRVVEALVDALAAYGQHQAAASVTGAPGADTSSNASFLREVDVSNLPSLLQSSSKHVQETVGKLVSQCENRERHWSRKWRKEKEGRKRWEEVVQKVLGVEGGNLPGGAGGLASLGTRGNGLESGVGAGGESGSTLQPPHPIHSDAASVLTDEDDSDAEFLETEEGDDVFYDAVDGPSALSAKPSGFIEGVFGFDSIDRRPSGPPTRPTLRSVHSTASSSLIPAGQRQFITRRDMSRATVGYPSADAYRTVLPLDPSKPKPSLAVWSFLKSAIGKDLSKVTLPVLFNEPLSMLQRMCEDIEYIELLSLAACVGRGTASLTDVGTDDKVKVARNAATQLGLKLEELAGLEGEEARLIRIMYVGAYAMSNYSSTVGRVNKPFNPMLGETYEVVRDDKGCRYLSEQVCHHPPISACYCESPDYTFWTEVNVTSKFWGKSMEIHPQGMCHVKLPVPTPGATASDDTTPVQEFEHYSWKKVTTNVNNIIVGKLWIDHYGDMVVRNYRTGEECIITFKPKNAGGGWFGMGSSKKSKAAAAEDAEDNGGGEISGMVKDANGVVRYTIKGRWDDAITAHAVAAPGAPPLKFQTVPLWRRTPPPPLAAQNFHFTTFATTLNQLTPALARVLPPTDSRLRPDQQAMERGEWDAATTHKEYLETLQRDRRKRLVADYESSGRPSAPPSYDTSAIPIGEKWWVPRWFVREVEGDSGEEHWRFNGEYWKLREAAAEQCKGGEIGQDGAAWPDWVLDVFDVVKAGKA
ncbi:Oxysterol-binding protein-domain-containing protein [Phlyctochytrium arcticum]|nr:Oxysterol-binding protein-domain-containing protein [Phlyctochytrium arcticum]